MAGKQDHEDKHRTDKTRSLFSTRLRIWRLSQNIPLKVVADDLGISIAAWNRWENGERFPEADQLKRLAEYMKIPICTFFYEDYDFCEKCRDFQRGKSAKKAKQGF